MDPVAALQEYHEWLLRPRVTSDTIIWDKIRAILAKSPLYQADINQIIQLESEHVWKTRRNTQLIIVILTKKALDENNPQYHEYAEQMAETMEAPIARAWKRIIEQKKKSKEIS